MSREARTTAGLHRSVGSDGTYAEARLFATPSELVDGRVRVLVVDGDPAAARGCASLLQSEGYLVTECDRGDETLTLIETGAFEIVLIADTPQLPKMQLLRACLRAHEGVLAIMVMNASDVSENLQALDQGAWDCLPKPISVADLRLRVGRAAEAARLARAAALARADGSREVPDADLRLLGRSHAFTQALEIARRVAPTDANVLVTGEPGVGKELIARYIHRHSRRSDRALVALSCASLPETLLEGELFGQVRGAFAGAVRDKAGLLETVRGGTLFLDEVTELPPALQVRLLQAIQDGVLARAGSAAPVAQDAPLDVRFITATSRDPRQEVAGGGFSSDLYHLLCVVPLRLPALRERPEDIPLLAQYFLVRYWAKLRDRDEPVPQFAPSALRALQERTWPGNVRELQDTIEHAVVLLPPGAKIRADDLAGTAHPNASLHIPPLPSLGPDGGDQTYHTTRERLLADFETRYLSWLLARTAGNMSRAARIAGVDRTTLYRLMEKHGLHRQTVVLDGQS
jgi:DNA-binding NtrC family response regulator